jgi:hypothetical protein
VIVVVVFVVVVVVALVACTGFAMRYAYKQRVTLPVCNQGIGKQVPGSMNKHTTIDTVGKCVSYSVREKWL